MEAYEVKPQAVRTQASISPRLDLLDPRSLRVWLSKASLKFILRGLGVCVIALTAVFIGYSSVHDAPPNLRLSGGLHSCFHCGSGWNWHLLLFVLAYAFVVPESVMALTSPLLGRYVVILLRRLLSERASPAYAPASSVHRLIGKIEAQTQLVQAGTPVLAGDQPGFSNRRDNRYCQIQAQRNKHREISPYVHRA